MYPNINEVLHDFNNVCPNLDFTKNKKKQFY